MHKPTSLGAIAALAAVVCSAPSVTAQEPARKLALEDYLDWERVSGPRISPDGKQIVFTRSWVDQIDDRWRSDLWIMNRDGSRPRFLAKGSSPRWSPDGTRLAFLRKGEPKGSQIHVMWLDSREVTQISRLGESPSGVRWSPDGKTLSFSMTVPEKPGFSIKLPKRPKGAEWAEEPRVVSRLVYRRDRRGYRARGWRHIFLIDAEGGRPRQLTAGDFDHGTGEWLPDGSGLVFSGNRSERADWEPRESEVYRVGLDGAVAQLTTRKGRDSGPVPSPDGKLIAYTGQDDRGQSYSVTQLYVMDSDGGNVRCISESVDRSMSGPAWGEDGSLWCNVEDSGDRYPVRFDLRGNWNVFHRQNEQFTMDHLIYVDSAPVVVGRHTSPQQPRDIAVMERAEIRRVTGVNGDILDGVSLGQVQEMRYPSSVDGRQIEGWVVYPPDFDPSGSYPMILQIHGGPHAMYGVDFSFERQQHAAEGYVVLYTNPRGSTGYGSEFGNLIQNDYPNKDYNDLMDGVDALISRGGIDPERLYVYGGSGGGVLTAWIVGQTDRFASAVSMFPVINWISFVGTTDGSYWYTNFERLPWEGIEEHWRRSPLRLVGNVTTPTMLLTGELDLRTPMAQTEEYYQALRLRGIDSVMVRVPGEYHGAASLRPSNWLRRTLYVRGWFERYPSRGVRRGGEADVEPDTLDASATRR